VQTSDGSLSTAVAPLQGCRDTPPSAGAWNGSPPELKPVYHGHEGVRQYWRETLAAFGEIDFEVEELIDADDQVLAVIREREVGRASGVPVEATHLVLYTLSGGKVVSMQVFDDRQQALEAAGLAD
jgi:ketosteroid isomerase-like protein